MKPLYRKMQGLFLYPDITLSSVFFPVSLLISFFFVILLLSLQNKIGEKSKATTGHTTKTSTLNVYTTHTG